MISFRCNFQFLVQNHRRSISKEISQLKKWIESSENISFSSSNWRYWTYDWTNNENLESKEEEEEEEKERKKEIVKEETTKRKISYGSLHRWMVGIISSNWSEPSKWCDPLVRIGFDCDWIVADGTRFYIAVKCRTNLQGFFLLSTYVICPLQHLLLSFSFYLSICWNMAKSRCYWLTVVRNIQLASAHPAYY